MVPFTLSEMEKEGYTLMESPEWTPVRSTSSMMPGTNTSRPSQMASTSTGLSSSTSTAVFR